MYTCGAQIQDLDLEGLREGVALHVIRCYEPVKKLETLLLSGPMKISAFSVVILFSKRTVALVHQRNPSKEAFGFAINFCGLY